MTQRARTSDVKLPGHEEPIAPVTILDEQGRVVRVIRTVTPPQQGNSLELTIDVETQRIAEKALK